MYKGDNMVDFLGNELKVGDRVVYITVSTNEYSHGIIKKLNPKTCVVLDIRFNQEFRREYSKVISINKLL